MSSLSKGSSALKYERKISKVTIKTRNKLIFPEGEMSNALPLQGIQKLLFLFNKR